MTLKWPPDPLADRPYGRFGIGQRRFVL